MYCLCKNECRFLKLVRFGAFVFLCLWCCFLGWLVEWDFVTDKLVSFYHHKYWKRVLRYCIIDIEHGIGNKENMECEF